MTCAVCPNCGYDITPVDAVFTLGDLRIEHGVFVTWKGRPVELSAIERLFVLAVARLEGTCIKRPALAEACGYEGEGSRSNYISVYLNRLNARFRIADPTFDRLQSVRHEGLRWRVDA